MALNPIGLDRGRDLPFPSVLSSLVFTLSRFLFVCFFFGVFFFWLLPTLDTSFIPEGLTPTLSITFPLFLFVFLLPPPNVDFSLTPGLLLELVFTFSFPLFLTPPGLSLLLYSVPFWVF